MITDECGCVSGVSVSLIGSLAIILLIIHSPYQTAIDKQHSFHLTLFLLCLTDSLFISFQVEGIIYHKITISNDTNRYKKDEIIVKNVYSQLKLQAFLIHFKYEVRFSRRITDLYLTDLTRF